jgi:hypothetical protein
LHAKLVIFILTRQKSRSKSSFIYNKNVILHVVITKNKKNIRKTFLYIMKQTNVKPANGRLGIMVVGNGAVATTFMTGVLMARKGLAKPIGAMTQYDKIRVGRGTDKKYMKYKMKMIILIHKN